MTPLIHQLAHSIKTQGDQLCLVDGERRVTRQELLVAAAAFAQELQRLDSERGDHVAIMLPNGVGWAASYLACQLLGAVAVAINPLATPSELRQYQETAEFKVLITGGPLLEAAAVLDDCSVLDAASVQPSAEMAGKAIELLQQAVANAKPHDPAVIIFTSGTTGASKATLLSQQNLGSNTLASNDAFHVAVGEKMLIVLPLFHSYGLLIFNLMFVTGGVSVLQARFHPSQTLKLFHDEGINLSVLVPPMIALMARMIAKGGADAKPAGLRLVVSGGAALPPVVYESWDKVTGIPLLNGYGQTEAAPLISVNRVESNRYPSVGQAVRDVEVKILNDDGEDLPVGEIGEIAARGPNIMVGYYGDVDASQETVDPEGWLKTGDFGRLDGDGYLYITGRKKELIIVSGENVYPNEVEDVILGVPSTLR